MLPTGNRIKAPEIKKGRRAKAYVCHGGNRDRAGSAAPDGLGIDHKRVDRYFVATAQLAFGAVDCKKDRRSPCRDVSSGVSIVNCRSSLQLSRWIAKDPPESVEARQLRRWITVGAGNIVTNKLRRTRKR